MLAFRLVASALRSVRLENKGNTQTHKRNPSLAANSADLRISPPKGYQSPRLDKLKATTEVKSLDQRVSSSVSKPTVVEHLLMRIHTIH